jgi:hypothetical protein
MNLNKIYPRPIVTDMLNLVRGWQALPPMSTTMVHGEPHLGNGRCEQTFVQKPQEVKQDAEDMQMRILEAKFDLFLE